MVELAGQPGVFYRDQALRQQGRLLEALGRKDEALAAYKKYVEEFPPPRGGIGLGFVTTRLEELDPALLESLAKPDMEIIDAPAPASGAASAPPSGAGGE
jgi:tetratricopeptide (TPR) repeat protein